MDYQPSQLYTCIILYVRVYISVYVYQSNNDSPRIMVDKVAVITESVTFMMSIPRLFEQAYRCKLCMYDYNRLLRVVQDCHGIP